MHPEEDFGAGVFEEGDDPDPDPLWGGASSLLTYGGGYPSRNEHNNVKDDEP